MCVKKKSTEYAEGWGGVQESHSLRSEAAVTNSNESFTQILIQQFERLKMSVNPEYHTIHLMLIKLTVPVDRAK